MPRLSDATLRAATVADVPVYDRAAVGPGIVHLGLGAFARAHLAVYIDELLAAGVAAPGIVGVSLRHRDVPDALAPQSGLYTVATVDSTATAYRIVGSIGRVLHAPSEPTAVRAALAAPDTTIVTITVTEKGYCRHPATRRLDWEHPDVRHDVAMPELPRGLLGHLLLAAADRRAAGAGPVTVVSLDNLSANGTTLKSVLLELTERLDPGLVPWIESHMGFPNSMVDRMVPATDDEFRGVVADAIGLADAGAVRAEPYRQWVVEREWASEAPPLAQVGVEFVDDVAPWERLKLRILNGLHTTAALYGLRHGLATVDEVTADPGGRELLDRVAAEICEVVEGPRGVDVAHYIDTTFGRFANAALGHRCAQIATDTSQKLPQRLLDTARERLERALPIDAIAEVVGLWGWWADADAADPMASAYAEIAAECAGDAGRRAAALVGLDAIFGDLVGHPAFVAAVTTQLSS